MPPAPADQDDRAGRAVADREGTAIPGAAAPGLVIRGVAAAAADAAVATVPGPDPQAEALAFVRFCYRRRAVAWPELYDEMCAVAARGEYRGLGYEQLEGLGIRFVLAALPHLAETAARVIAEERGRAQVMSAA